MRLSDRQRIDRDSTRPVVINLMRDGSVRCCLMGCGNVAYQGGRGVDLNSFAYCRAHLGVRGQKIR